MTLDDGNGATTMSREDAEEFTAALGQSMGGNVRLIALAQRQGVPKALGMTTEAWVSDRLGGYVRLSIPERREVVAELAEEGLSQREIAAVVGVGKSTVDRDLDGPNGTKSAKTQSDNEGLSQEDVPFGPEEADFWGDDEPDESIDAPLLAVVDLETGEIIHHPVGNGNEEEDVLPMARPHVAHNSGEHEWYTPPEYIKAAVAVLGAIDLDPASTTAANAVVKAARFYTIEDDGLQADWAGRVWMNPPYQQPLIEDFCTRLAREYGQGTVTEAIALVNNATETKWFQEVAAQCSALCFPRGRVKFWHPHKESAPLQGQAVLYLGANASAFRAAFVRFGFVTERADGS